MATVSSSSTEAAPAAGPDREHAFGELREPSALDRFNSWLSGSGVRRRANLRDARFADFGCGYEARFARSVMDRVRSATLVDLALSPALKEMPKVTAIERPIEEAARELPDASFDVIACLSVLEHLREPQAALDEFHRLLAPGGALLINVPSWLGKPVLELFAFRLGISPKDEMNDHKRYYNPRDLWPMLVDAGFRPSEIRCRWYKLGFCTFAVARIPEEGT